MNIRLVLGGIFFLFLYSSCQKELINPDERLLIQEFLAQKGISAQEDSKAGYFIYYYEQLTPSDTTILIKATLDKGMKATVKYKASLLDETIIHQVTSTPETIDIDEAIVGLQLILARIAVGEKVLAVLPSRLAYGETSLDNIPANSIIVVEIELMNIHPHL